MCPIRWGRAERAIQGGDIQAGRDLMKEASDTLVVPTSGKAISTPPKPAKMIAPRRGSTGSPSSGHARSVIIKGMVKKMA